MATKIKKCIIGLTYFFFWLFDWFVCVQTSSWISLPSSDTQAPSMKAILLNNDVDLITSIVLGTLFCLIITRMSNNKLKRVWESKTNIITIILMFIIATFSILFDFFTVNFIDIFVSIVAMIICFFTVGLGIFDFYKLLRTWNIRWYYYGIILQELAMTMILFGFENMC